MLRTPAPVYAEVYEFLASAPSRGEILAFRPSESAHERFHVLLNAARNGAPTDEMAAKLDEWERVEHLVRMVKLTPRKQMQQP